MRKINHPKYKHFSLTAALEYIKDQPIGDFVIRPSSQGPGYLTLTWKFWDKVYVHLSIMEDKSQGIK